MTFTDLVRIVGRWERYIRNYTAVLGAVARDPIELGYRQLELPTTQATQLLHCALAETLATDNERAFIVLQGAS